MREISKRINIIRDLVSPDKDLKSSKILLDNYEFGLALYTIITQIYEYDILVSQDFYDLAKDLPIKLSYKFDYHQFTKELMRFMTGKSRINYH